MTLNDIAPYELYPFIGIKIDINIDADVGCPCIECAYVKEKIKREYN